MAKHSKKGYLGISLKGMAMGAADVIPGVSGGTIAFITGIYEELLETISGLKLGLFKTWRKDGFKAMWTEMNGTFLLALFGGIFISILSLSVLVEYLLHNYETQLWSFFFGLIIASVWLVGKTVKKWNLLNIIGLLVGTAAAYFVTIMVPVGESEDLFYIFICGSIAVCAMILPGISGSFILLLLGAYAIILGAVSNLLKALKAGNWDEVFGNGLVLAVFVLGCLVGLILFSKLLNWLFKKAHDLTVAILTGFLIGSLNKIWPWKETKEWFIKHEGTPEEKKVPLVQENITPEQFENLEGEPSYLLAGIGLMLTGFAVIIVLDYFGRKKPQSVDE